MIRDYNNILISDMQTKLDQLEKSFAKLTISTAPLQSIQLNRLKNENAYDADDEKTFKKLYRLHSEIFFVKS